MKIGKRRVQRGDLDGGERAYWRALEFATDYDNPYRKHIGLIEHRLAEISAKRGDIEQARWRFKKAAARIENDLIGLAICLRDHAGFEILQSENTTARVLLNRALKQLEKATKDIPTNRKKRLDIEVSVTRAFLARVDIKDDRNVPEAITQLMVTATLLQQYRRKPAYELANLSWLIDALPSGERTDYLARARKLSLQLSNYYKWGEYTALQYGEVSRDFYRLTIGIASFGLKGLKELKHAIS